VANLIYGQGDSEGYILVVAGGCLGENLWEGCPTPHRRWIHQSPWQTSSFISTQQSYTHKVQGMCTLKGGKFSKLSFQVCSPGAAPFWVCSKKL